ncbi:MAG: HU family DNA-binding protein [Rubrivivax sp.]|nr:HU family DNA-binding protein [Rubrivivax sp.]
MATAKKAAGAAAKTTRKTPAKTARPAAAKKSAAAKPAPIAKPIKTAFSKTELNKHLAEATGVDAKAVKAVVAALEATILMSVHKAGLGQFTLPGLLKATVVKVPAKKKRFGKDPFTGQERWFPAKPASTKIKVRPMKKLKDAAGG